MFCHCMQGGRASRGTLGGPGDLAAEVCRVGGPRGLFLKSNDPNLSGGELGGLTECAGVRKRSRRYSAQTLLVADVCQLRTNYA